MTRCKDCDSDLVAEELAECGGWCMGCAPSCGDCGATPALHPITKRGKPAGHVCDRCNRERAWSKRLQVTQGCARKLRASVLYVSPDGRAVVWSYDSSTKYLNASMFWADSENEIGVTLFRSESTLRASRSKKPAEVRLKLPKGPKGSWWLFSLSAGRYDGVIHMWRYDPEETREHR